MEFVAHFVELWTKYAPVLASIFMALWALSEALAAIPSVKANSVFQAIQNGVKWALANIFKKPIA